jgi:hypothetical protein
MTIQEIRDSLAFIQDVWARACTLNQPLHSLKTQADCLISGLESLHLKAHLVRDERTQLEIEALTEAIEAECVERWITGDTVHFTAH